MPPLTIGIRRESDRKFEARTPLTPDHLRQLQARFGAQIRFLVQPAPLRTYLDEDYTAAGATLQTDLSEADIMLCVKEVYPEQLIDGKTYLVFAHVIKGQPDNMPILQALIDRGITLLDYESITNAQGQRTVFFGRAAGQTGMVETLRALGQRLSALGRPCVFDQLRPVSEYADLAAAKAHLKALAQQIAHRPERLGITKYPLVFGFAGLGNVGQGAMEIFDLLPVQTVMAADLPALFANPSGGLYKCPLSKAETLRSDRGPFDPADYARHPDRYFSRVPELLPYLTVLLNGVFWAQGLPRLLPQDALAAAWDGSQRLQVVGDLSCDPPAGSMGCTVEAGDLYSPVFGYDPHSRLMGAPFEPDLLTVMAVDNLSAGLPRDASIAFSTMLLHYLPDLIRAYLADGAHPPLPPDLARAIVTHDQALTAQFDYLRPYLQAHALLPAPMLI